MLTLDASVWVAAFDPRDRFHAGSIAFLRKVARNRLRLHGPAFVLIESACALARRARSAATGQEALERLRTHPTLLLHPVSERLLASAQALGLRQLLRGADALYAATAALLNVPLVSWDDELVDRAGAVTPEQWLAEHS
jgi:predicted nucleic acid-binding protein